MKLYLEDDNGQKTEVTQIEELSAETDIIILKSDMCWNRNDVRREEKYYSRKLGKRVVIIDGKFSKVLGIASGGMEEDMIDHTGTITNILAE